MCGSGLSANELNSFSFNVYPNPTTGMVTIETDEKLITYKVFNEAAQQVHATGQIKEGQCQINLEGMSAGLYFIVIKPKQEKLLL